MFKCRSCGNAKMTGAEAVETGVTSVYQLTSTRGGKLGLSLKRVDGGDLVVICPSCGAENQLPPGTPYRVE